MTPDEKPHFFDKPANVKKFLRGFYIVAAILVAVEFVYDRHVYHPWESLWGFYALFGFVACWLLVEVAKLIRAALGRDPDYYEKD